MQTTPPETEHVEAVVRALPAGYRLPALALDATGIRISELVSLTWATSRSTPDAGAFGPTRRRGGCSLDRPHRPGRARRGLRLTPPEDREPDASVFPDLDDARLRTAIHARARDRDPHFSPHDLRHRRISLLALRGVPIPRVSAYVGHARGSMRHDTCSHVLEASEPEYAELLV